MPGQVPTAGPQSQMPKPGPSHSLPTSIWQKHAYATGKGRGAEGSGQALAGATGSLGCDDALPTTHLMRACLEWALLGRRSTSAPPPLCALASATEKPAAPHQGPPSIPQQGHANHWPALRPPSPGFRWPRPDPQAGCTQAVDRCITAALMTKVQGRSLHLSPQTAHPRLSSPQQRIT